jgi:regulator of protease activity HflC (stomatin/prohibitin superfamily)
MFNFWVLALILVIFFLWSAIKILKEYERGVIFRLGRIIKTKGPGLIILFATSQLAQTTLRSVCGQVELDEILSKREKINSQLQDILDKSTDPWGIKVSTVEVKHIELTEEMKRSMAKQAEAERERRAKIINAEGEFQAANKLVEAAGIISKHPEALQLRYLQTMREMSSENSTTTFFPIPIDLMSVFKKNE